MNNKKVFLLTIFLFYNCLWCIGQENPVDSLKGLLKLAKEDTNRINALIALSKNYLGSDPETSLQYATEALEQSEKQNFQRGMSYAYKNIGIAYYMQGKYVEALNHWQQALSVFEQLKDQAGVANMLSNIGAIYFDQADDEHALENYLKALKVSELNGDTLRIATVLINIGAIYGNKANTRDKALEYFLRALPLSEYLGDNDAIGTTTVNLGEMYFLKGNDSLALFYLEKSLKAYQDSANVPYTLNIMGKVYARAGNYNKAIKYQLDALNLAKQLDAKLDMTKALIGLAKTYQEKGDLQLSMKAFKDAEVLAGEVNANLELKQIYEGLAFSYAKTADYGNAFKYQTLLISIKDTLYNIDTDKKLQGLQFNYEIDKKESQINLLTKDKAIQDANLQRQKVIKNVFIGGFGVVLLFAGVFFTQRNRISKEKKRSDELLLNILPEETAEELKATGKAKTKSFDSVSVLFTDFKNFTQASERLSAEDLVAEINHCYSEFDKIITRHGIEKIKTIGDAYMCAGGLPVSNATHATDVVRAGLEMQQFMEAHKKEREEKNLPFFELRLGIHSGPVVAGIVGIKKFAYDIWGDTVNTASRMESSGEIGKVNVSGATYELIKDTFNCTHRGKVKAKNKGEIDMYFVNS